MSCTRIQHVDEMKYAIVNAKLEDVCASSAKVFHLYGCVHYQDAILDILCYKHEVLANIHFVAYLVSRMRMLQNTYHKKNKQALRRVVCEISMVLAQQIRDVLLQTVVKLDVGIDSSKLESLLTKYSTEEASRIVTKIGQEFSLSHDIIDNILASKSYDITIPMMHVALSKDVLALVWKVLHDCVVCEDSRVKTYIDNMFELFLCRYKKASRKTRTKYLNPVLLMLRNHCIKEMSVFPTNVVIEALWKVGYIYEKLEENGKTKDVVNHAKVYMF